MYPNVHNTIISNIEKLRATQMSINNGMDKYNVLCSYNGILQSKENE